MLFADVFMTLLAVILLSVLAFWRPYAPLFMITAGASLMLGLCWYDAYTTGPGLTISLVFIGYALVCIAFAYRLIFQRESED